MTARILLSKAPAEEMMNNGTFGLAGIGITVVSIIFAFLEMSGQYWAAAIADVLIVVAFFLVFYGAIKAGAPFEWILCGSVLMGIGVFYGFEPQTVLTGSGLGLGLEHESLQSLAIVIILVAVVYEAALAFRKQPTTG